MLQNLANGIWKISWGEPEIHTPLQHRPMPPAAEKLQALPAAPPLPLQAADFDCQINRRGVTIRLPMGPTEDIYGFGLQLLSFNHAGKKRHIKVNSDPRIDTGESHAPVPFYLSTAGYGLLVDSYRYVTFYMGTSTDRGASSAETAVNQQHQEFSEDALYALKRSKEIRHVIIEIPVAQGADLYLFAGNLQQAVCRYNLFSGGGVVPPLWGLGNWYRVYGGSDQTQVLNLARQLRDEAMPITVLGLEPGWHSHSYSCTYEWSDLFPQPERMIQQLTAENYQLNLWEHAYVYPASPLYSALKEHSGSYEVWHGLVPDFADPLARQIFADYHKTHLVDAGIAGFKLDECDNSDNNPSNWGFPDSAAFPSGMDGEQMHNALGQLYQMTLLQPFVQAKRRTLSQVRSSGALATGLPYVLYSDLYDHKEFIRGLCTAAFSGLLWTPEVRSCQDAEDLLRRLETVIFSPLALLNCWRIPNPPWQQYDIDLNLQHKLLAKAPRQALTAAVRKILQLRLRLLPYLYSAFVDYYLSGRPPICPLVLDFETDPETHSIDDAFMFGPSLLVCPLTKADQGRRKVYLPVGTWYSFDGAERYDGGQWLQVTAAADEIPLFVRDNTLLPLAQPVTQLTDQPSFLLTVQSYGQGPASCVLYEDDFVSLDYQQQGFKAYTVSRTADGSVHYPDLGASHAYSWQA
ncbi:MAG: glycoside hydrolase family 31 protein [Oscillospiraceae bacterium]|nr:glycoside hydrolase family 31 protein [Oscillospiraceae bacterium]